LERNIRLYPWYYAASSFLAWLPIFFLYFSEDLGLKEVLLLESIYYIAVVILEIPTGYFSDLVGRRKTLLVGAVFLCLACVFYLIGGSFVMFTCGQIAFALFMSFTSGTNTVFHYESLAALGRDNEYGDREAIVNKYGMVAGGTAALVGGGLALIDFRLAYVATFSSALISLFILVRMSEPLTMEMRSEAKSNFINQLVASLKYLNIESLGWIAGYYVIIFSITHVPYEFYQPYIQLLEDDGQIWDSSTPILAGLLYAFARYIGAFGAAYSMVWKRKFGLRNHLLIQLLIVNLIVGAMCRGLHPIIIGMVLMRSLPWAAIKAPINEIITPLVGVGQRATFHSMLSLACRFVFFCVLFLLSLLIPNEAISDWPNLRLLLSYCFVGGIALSAVIIWTSSVLKKE
jgi:MFS family permease